MLGALKSASVGHHFASAYPTPLSSRPHSPPLHRDLTNNIVAVVPEPCTVSSRVPPRKSVPPKRSIKRPDSGIERERLGIVPIKVFCDLENIIPSPTASAGLPSPRDEEVVVSPDANLNSTARTLVIKPRPTLKRSLSESSTWSSYSGVSETSENVDQGLHTNPRERRLHLPVGNVFLRERIRVLCLFGRGFGSDREDPDGEEFPPKDRPVLKRVAPPKKDIVKEPEILPVEPAVSTPEATTDEQPRKRPRAKTTVPVENLLSPIKESVDGDEHDSSDDYEPEGAASTGSSHASQTSKRKSGPSLSKPPQTRAPPSKFLKPPPAFLLSGPCILDPFTDEPCEVDMSLFPPPPDPAPLIQWKGSPLVIPANSPRFSELADGEIKCCEILRMLPAIYLDIKETLLATIVVRGPYKKRDAQGWFRVDVNKTNKLYDWFCGCGWIKIANEEWDRRTSQRIAVKDADASMEGGCVPRVSAVL